MEPVLELNRPLLAQSSGGQNDGAFTPAALLQLAEDQRRLNRLAQSNFIRDEQADGQTAHHSQRGLELERKDIDGGRGSRSQLPECSTVLKVKTEEIHPGRRRDHPDARMPFLPHGSIERVENS